MGEISIVRDELPDDDAFGPHSRLAKRLADHICAAETGDTIGLEGDWGSGKSSALYFLKKELDQKQEKSTAYFLFDAWAHEGDELRKSFLDEFNQNLTLNKDRREKLRDQIWSEKETIKRDSHTSIRLRAIFFAVSIALLPVFGSLLSILEKDQKYVLSLFNLTLTNTNLWLLNLIFLGLLLPFVFIIMGLVAAFATKRKNNCTYKSALQKTFRFLNLDDKQSIDNVTVSSSSSFRKFKDDLCDIVSSKPKNIEKVVVAIDNIDRLEPSVARRFWSSLAPFFERAKSRDKSLKCLTLILPYSRNHLTSVFERSAGVEEENSSDQLIEETDGFIRKSFDLLFEVPPPLLSSWQDFLEDTLKLVFPTLKKNDDELKRISILYGDMLLERPTPRRIKQFVNQISTTQAQLAAPETIPLRVIAAYILNKSKWSSGTERQPKAFELDSRHQDILNRKDYKTDFASILFGVSRMEAPIALMEYPVLQALQTNNSDDLDEWSEFPHFDDVVASLTYRSAPSSTENILTPANIVRTLANSIASARLSLVWGHLAKVIPRTMNWREIDDWSHIIRSIQANLETNSLESFNSAIRRKLEKIDKERWDEENTDWNHTAKLWTDAATLVATPEKEIEIPKGLNITVQALAKFISKNHTLAECPWKPSKLSSESKPFDIPKIAGLHTYQIVGAATLMHQSGVYEKALKTIPDIQNLFADQDSFTYSAAAAHLSVLISRIEVIEDPNAKQTLIDLFENGSIPPHITTDIEDSKELLDSAILIGALSITSNSHAETLASEVLSSPEDHEKVIQNIKNYFRVPSSPEKLFSLALKNEETLFKLGIYLYKEILQEVDAITFDVNLLLKSPGLTFRFQHAYANLSDNNWDGLLVILRKSTNTDEVYEKVIGLGFGEEHSYLYQLLLKFKKTDRHEFFIFMSDGLHEIDAARWLKDIQLPLNRTSNLTAVAIELRKNDKTFSLGNHARDAISSAASQIFAEEEEWGEYKSKTITALLNVLDNTALESCQRDILRAFDKNPSLHALDHLESHFGLQRFNSRVVSDKASSLLHHIECLLREASSIDEELLQILLRVFRSQPNIYKKASLNTKRPFRVRLLDEVDNAVDANRGLLEQVIKELGIRRPKS